MRERKRWALASFATTAAAMAMEQAACASGAPGRLIPIPRSITAGCGMAWRCETADRAACEKAAVAAKVEVAAWYEIEM